MRWIHAFPKDISMEWNTNSLIQDLILHCSFHFLTWWSFKLNEWNISFHWVSQPCFIFSFISRGCWFNKLWFYAGFNNTNKIKIRKYQVYIQRYFYFFTHRYFKDVKNQTFFLVFNFCNFRCLFSFSFSFFLQISKLHFQFI